jgi:hypothetical protein
VVQQVEERECWTNNRKTCSYVVVFEYLVLQLLRCLAAAAAVMLCVQYVKSYVLAMECLQFRGASSVPGSEVSP